MFESIACECYGLLADSLEASDLSRLPSKVVEDWWNILENHDFELSGESNLTLPGISSSACYRSSLLQHIQAIRNIPHRDFDVLREEIFATDPLHVTYDHFGSQLEKSPEAEISAPSQLTPVIKPEIKIRLTLKRGHPPSIPDHSDQEYITPLEGEEDISQEETTKRKRKIKFKFSSPVPPPPPSSSRASRKAISSSSPSSASPLPSPPLSRTRGKRLPLSFLQSVTDIDVDHQDDANPYQDLAVDTTAAVVGDTDTWIDESEDQDFLDDQEAQEQLRTDHIADFLDEDEYEDHRSKGSSNRKRRLSGERSTPAATPSSQPRKMKQKLGPGALLRKKLSGKH